MLGAEGYKVEKDLIPAVANKGGIIQCRVDQRPRIAWIPPKTSHTSLKKSHRKYMLRKGKANRMTSLSRASLPTSISNANEPGLTKESFLSHFFSLEPPIGQLYLWENLKKREYLKRWTYLITYSWEEKLPRESLSKWDKDYAQVFMSIVT